MNPIFALYLASRAPLTLASSMLSVAVGWHIYAASGNPFDLALVGLMQILPVLGLFVVTGWAADNLQRKFILVVCALLQGLVLAGLAVSFGGDEFNRVAVFGLLFLNGVANAFYNPAIQAILPSIVAKSDLSRAVNISNTTWTAGSAAGPVVAGLLIAWVDTSIYQILAGLSFGAGVLLMFLPGVTVRRPAGRGVEQLVEGILFVYKNPLVLPAISLDLVLVLLSSVMALLPIYAIDVLNVGPEGLGFMRAMPAAGAVVAGVIFSSTPSMRHSGTILYVSLAIFAASVIVFALSSVFWLSLAALFVYGASDMVSVNVRMTIIQLATPDSLRGRVNSVNSLFIAASNDLGEFRAGTVATLISPVATVLTGGLMAIGVVASAYFLFPTLRRLDKITDAEVATQ